MANKVTLANAASTFYEKLKNSGMWSIYWFAIPLALYIGKERRNMSWNELFSNILRLPFAE